MRTYTEILTRFKRRETKKLFGRLLNFLLQSAEQWLKKYGYFFVVYLQIMGQCRHQIGTYFARKTASRTILDFSPELDAKLWSFIVELHPVCWRPRSNVAHQCSGLPRTGRCSDKILILIADNSLQHLQAATSACQHWCYRTSTIDEYRDLT
jgi:hypothetical protein